MKQALPSPRPRHNPTLAPAQRPLRVTWQEALEEGPGVNAGAAQVHVQGVRVGLRIRGDREVAMSVHGAGVAGRSVHSVHLQPLRRRVQAEHRLGGLGRRGKGVEIGTVDMGLGAEGRGDHMRGMCA